MVELTELQKGYLLCAVDSEGCITISKNALPRLSRGFTYRPEVKISNNDLGYLNYIQSFAGGRLDIKKKRQGQYELSFRRDELLNNGLLKIFENGLIIKSKQAKLIREFYKLSERGKRGSQLFEQKTKLFVKIHMLNQENKTQQVQAMSKDIHLPSKRDG